MFYTDESYAASNSLSSLTLSNNSSGTVIRENGVPNALVVSGTLISLD